MMTHLKHLLETTAALDDRLSADDFDPTRVDLWLPLVEEVIAAWREVYTQVGESADGMNTLYHIASAIRYGDQTSPAALARWLRSIHSGEFGIE